MNDQKVLIFGSFTEDEIKTLQSQPTTGVEITFGSLDSATLKSVGIFDTKLTEFDHSKNLQLSQLAHRENVTGGHCNKGKPIKSVGETIKEYGSSSFTNPAYNRSVLHPTVNARSAYDSSEKSSLLQCAADNVSELSNSVEDINLTNQPKNYNLVNGSHKSLKASNGSAVVFRSLLPRGLVNLGNLCFLNATLQALLSCSPFVHLLQELKSRDITEAGYPTLHAFVQFISNFGIFTDSSMNKKETIVPEIGLPFRPLMFESVLKNFTPDVLNSLTGRPRQEDAQEFLSYLMHQMHDELLKLEGQIPNGVGRNSSLVSSTDDEEEDDDWETVGPRNRTAVTRTQSFVPSKLSEIFGGQLKSVVKAKGNKASATVQPFLLLHLNIYPELICSIEDALRMFSAPEALEGYRTSASGKAEVVSASKSVKILELSDIMVLHLMRFSYGTEGSTKLHKPVHFPLELVFGRELLASSSEGRRYELVATITHHGRDPSKGHYTADARHPSGKWLRYDDVSVTAIPTSKVLHDQAYILFYKQL
ncbi:Ubiquitin carboxyl-terminal hydrolase 24 [Datura stramonium]|uniref:Ubiquitin carboxyl-terminal hydrolase n=1 Tax=Datura stramonium TaxID=4076 RepID=A0ABS8WW72_DATST|nr:Ubiquitin carboxyl-terminal hydrolase 24 [Datura stramonium]